MKINLLLLLLLVGGLLLGGCSPSAEPNILPVATHPAKHSDNVLTTDYRRLAAADSIMELNHQQAMIIARDVNLNSLPAFQAMEKQHALLLARHRQLQARYHLLEQHLSSSPNATKQPADSLRIADQRLRTEYKKVLFDHEQMQAEHDALLTETGH